MSVQEQLTKFAQDPQDKYQGPKFNEGKPGLQDMQEMMQTEAIPGQSLTQDPGSRLPYETEPKYSKLQDFVDESFLKMSEPEGLPLLFDAMRKGVPVEYIAQKFLENEVQIGNINTDVMLQAIEPTIYILVHLATYGGIEPVLYPEESMLDPEEPKGGQAAYFKQASRGLLKEEDDEEEMEGKKTNTVTANDLVAPAVQPKSLLSRTKQAVSEMPNEPTK